MRWKTTIQKTAKISALSSGNIQKYEYLTGEDILPSNQQRIIEQAKLISFFFGKSFWKANKNNLRSVRKTNKSDSRSGTS